MAKNNFAIFCLFFLAAVGSIEGYCDFKSRILHTKISKALVQTSRWLINEQDHEGKWIDLHTTGNVLAVLKMIGHDMNDYNTCSNTFKKASDYFMANKFGIKQAYGGRLAYIIMGLNSLCTDPSNYNNMNLTDNLLKDVISFPKGEFNHYFQYSLALMALGVNDVKVPWPTVERLITKIKHILRTGERHSKDTCSLFIMALKSVAGQFRDSSVRFNEINRYINMLANALSMKTKVDKDNLWTKSLVMQAQSAANRTLLWQTARCEQLYESLLSMQERNGSFGSLSAVLHVLPSLAGVSYLDLMKFNHCDSVTLGKKSKEMMGVCVKIEFKAINKPNPMLQVVTVPKGSTALDVLRTASQEDSCYQFETKTTAWGEYLTQLCRARESPTKKVHWMFYVDDKLARSGISKHVMKENECVILKYEKLSYK